MKIVLETEKCIGCGACAALCAQFFELKNNGKSHLRGGQVGMGGKNEELEVKEAIGCAKDVVGACPVQCIHIE